LSFISLLIPAVGRVCEDHYSTLLFTPLEKAITKVPMQKEIKNAQGEKIDFSFHEGQHGSHDIVVIGHGVTGNKDRPFVVALAEGLAKAGLPALRFSFAGNGASGGKFTDCTISKEVEDLGAVLDMLADRSVCYVGHSMGGAVGVLRAAKDRRIRAIVSLAGMVHTKAFAEREFGSVKPDAGFMWDDPKCPLLQKYIDDMARINSVIDSAPQIRVPWLLVHGTADDVVPIQDSYDIFGQANMPKEILELPGADHVFSGPYTTPMVEKVVSWIRRQFESK
jgi:alpha/beta superfamily hydrolase